MGKNSVSELVMNFALSVLSCFPYFLQSYDEVVVGGVSEVVGCAGKKYIKIWAARSA